MFQAPVGFLDKRILVRTVQANTVSLVSQNRLLRNTDVKVSVLTPSARTLSMFVFNSSGPIDTPIFRNAEAQGIVSSATFSAGTQLGRMGKPREVAEVLMFLLSDRAAYVTGGISNRDLANEAAWTVDGGLTAS